MELKEIPHSLCYEPKEGEAIVELINIANHNPYNTSNLHHSDYGVLLRKFVLSFDLDKDKYLDCIQFVRDKLNPRQDNRLQIRVF